MEKWFKEERRQKGKGDASIIREYLFRTIPFKSNLSLKRTTKKGG